MKYYPGENFAVLIAASFLLFWNQNIASAQSEAELFLNPPSKTRILKIVHSLPDKPEQQDSLFNTLKKQGFGGIVCNVSFDKYLQSEEKWESFLNGIKKAKERGFSMWLYDERGYPSGNAGGLVLKTHPEWEARGLLILTTNLQQAQTVKIQIPDGTLILAKAFPKQNGICITKKAIDLKGFVKKGWLEWDVPKGNWQIAIVSENRLYEGTHADMNLWEKIPYINLLKPEPTARFIELTHEEYSKRIESGLSNYFEATFTDEPSLMSLFLRKMPWKVLPWSDNLPVEFKKRRGYEIEKNLESLFLETDQNWKRHRYDFWLTVGELVSENYFRQIRDWCRKHNLLSGGHLLAEEGLVNHVPLYGDFFRCIRFLDSPGIDCLTSIPAEVPWYIARLVSSAGWLEGRNVIMCETSDHSQVYRPAGDTRPKRIVTEDEIRGTLNRLFVNGVTRITSYYSFSQLTDEQLIRLNQQCGRCVWMIENSKPSPNIGVLYPVQTLWTKFIPSDLWSREATAAAKVEKVYRTIINNLFNEKYEFMVIDYDTLINSRIVDGKIANSHVKLDAIILPAVDTISLKAMENLDKFVKSGGKLVVVSALPANSETEFPSKKIQEYVRTWFGDKTDKPISKAYGSGFVCYLPSGFEIGLSEILKTTLSNDIRINDPESQLKISRRNMEDTTVFFVINDSNRKWTGDIEFLNCANGEIWNPVDGSITKNVASLVQNYSIQPYEMVFFKFKKLAAINDKKDSIKKASIRFIQENIDCAAPKIAKGEFVSAIMTESADKSTPTYQCDAILTKSEVDTWMFLIFPVNSAKNLDVCSAISFHVSIPSNQEVKNQILIIVKEKGGGDFIGETGLYLNERGDSIARISLSNLHLAGWSKDDDGFLNPQKIEEIRIGWGGYLGREGERIMFRTSAPFVEKMITY